MRRCLTVSLAILLLVAAVGGGCELYTAHAVADYRQAMLPVEAAILAGGWQRAQALAEKVAARWEKDYELVQLWVNHADADAVSRALRGLNTAVVQRDRLSALLYYGDCVENFAHLHHRDAFTLKNIL